MRVGPLAKVALRRGLHRVGLDLVRSLDSTDLLRRRMSLLESHGINVVFDVGANAGQWATTMRALGYQGRIVSFEPSADAFKVLEHAARQDDGWTAVKVALGATEGERTLHVSANSQSSSLLEMLPAHVTVAPDSAYVGDETVTVTTLATEIARRTHGGDRLFVKIDTQGSEGEVIAGARERLKEVIGWQVELSLVPLYDRQPLIEDVIGQLRELGYVAMSLEPDFFEPGTGRLLQADGVFFRPDVQAGEGAAG